MRACDLLTDTAPGTGGGISACSRQHTIGRYPQDAVRWPTAMLLLRSQRTREAHVAFATPHDEIHSQWKLTLTAGVDRLVRECHADGLGEVRI